MSWGTALPVRISGWPQVHSCRFTCVTHGHTHTQTPAVPTGMPLCGVMAGAEGGAALQDSAPPSAGSALVCTQSRGSTVHAPCWLRWYTSTGWHVSVELPFTVHISCDTYDTSDAFALACSTWTLPCPSPFHLSLFALTITELRSK